MAHPLESAPRVDLAAAPLLWTAIAFAAGEGLAWCGVLRGQVLLGSALACALATVRPGYAWLWQRATRRRARRTGGHLIAGVPSPLRTFSWPTAWLGAALLSGAIACGHARATLERQLAGLPAQATVAAVVTGAWRHTAFEVKATARLTAIDRTAIEPVLVQLRAPDAVAARYSGIPPGGKLKARVRIAAPRRPGLPGGYDEQLALTAQGIAAVAHLTGPPLALEAERGWGARLRAGLRGIGDGFAQEQGRAGRRARALVFGRRDALDAADVAALTRAGLAHLTSVSGLHIGLVAIAARSAGAFWPGGGDLVALLAVALYVAICGVSSPVLRAAFTLVAVVIAYRLGRKAEPLNTLGLVALGLLIWRPLWLFSISFQLSFAATAGLLLLTGRIRARLPGPPGLRTALAISLAAEAATAPIVLHTFGTISLVAPLANLLVAPFVAVAVTSGLAGVLLQVAHVPGERWVVRLSAEASDLVLTIARTLASWPAAQAHFAMWPTWCALVGLLAVFVSGAAAWRGTRAAAFIAVAALVVRGWQCDWPDLSGTDRLYLFGPPAGGSLLVRTAGGDDLLFAKSRAPESVGEALGAIGVQRLRLVVVLGGGVEAWRRALGGTAAGALWLGSGELQPIREFAPGSEVSRGAWSVRALDAGDQSAFTLRLGETTLVIGPELSVSVQRALARDWNASVAIAWLKGSGAEPVFWPWLAGLRPGWLLLQGSPGHPVKSETLAEARRFAPNTLIRQDGWAEFDLRSGRIAVHP